MNSIEKKLNEFIKLEKFTNEEWEKRGLISSGIEVSHYLNDFFNQCARDLMISKKENYKNCFNKSIKQINPLEYDTEERALIVDYFQELATICSFVCHNQDISLLDTKNMTLELACWTKAEKNKINSSIKLIMNEYKEND